MAPPPPVEELGRSYSSAYRVAFRLIGDPVDADVTARDALVRAGAARLHRFRSLEAASCLKAAALAVSDELWLGRSRCPAGGTGFGEVSHREDRRQLRMALRSLGSRERQVFVLEHLAGISSPQVARELRLDADVATRLGSRSLSKVLDRCAFETLIERAEAARCSSTWTQAFLRCTCSPAPPSPRSTPAPAWSGGART